MKKRNLIIVIVVVAIAVIAIITSGSLKAARAKNAVKELGSVSAIQKAEIVESTGEFDVHPYAELTWATSGTVELLAVKEGDKVKADDVLMSLRTTSVSASIISAKAQLLNAQKTLQDVMNSDTAKAQAWIALRSAETELDKAQEYRDSLNQTIKGERIKFVTINTPMGQKRIPSIVKYKYKADAITIANADANLALVKAKYGDALREYDRLKDGANRDDIAIAQANVDAAQSTVDSMNIIAPFDGEILFVNSTKGDVVNTGTPAVIIADTNHYYVEAQVDEADIAKVNAGQSVDITSDGLPDAKITGTVTAINPIGVNTGGLIKFTVRIALDKTDVPIYPGATANVTITISEPATHLLVPLAAVQNGADGEFVQVQKADGTLQQVIVTTGEMIGDNVIVSGDLKDGDQVIIKTTNALTIPGRNRTN